MQDTRLPVREPDGNSASLSAQNPLALVVSLCSQLAFSFKPVVEIASVLAAAAQVSQVGCFCDLVVAGTAAELTVANLAERVRGP